MSAIPTPASLAPVVLPPEVWPRDLATSNRPTLSWLLPGYLASGSVTLLTSPWKTGKTTLLAILLSRLKTGGQLLRVPLAAGKAYIVSEESEALWEQRHRKLGFGDVFVHGSRVQAYRSRTPTSAL